ncbi:hypothetical protein G6F56_012577 [Rhizopus delemar]|nr:hypothetical protein G6F56_012577 [Rhizopus delemar]
MKFIVFGIVTTAFVVSAQNSSVPDATVTTTPTRSSTSDCPVKSVFDLCLNNEEDYIKRCQENGKVW